MTIDDKIRHEKLQHDINRKAARISALSTGQIDKYEDFAGEEILPSGPSQLIQQTKFTYTPLGKVFGKQTEKQADALKSLKIPNKIDEIKQIESIFPKNQLN